MRAAFRRELEGYELSYVVKRLEISRHRVGVHTSITNKADYFFVLRSTFGDSETVLIAPFTDGKGHSASLL